jgi:hypothetical protein
MVNETEEIESEHTPFYDEIAAVTRMFADGKMNLYDIVYNRIRRRAYAGARSQTVVMGNYRVGNTRFTAEEVKRVIDHLIDEGFKVTEYPGHGWYTIEW